MKRTVILIAWYFIVISGAPTQQFGPFRYVEDCRAAKELLKDYGPKDVTGLLKIITTGCWEG
jgi:hypothetical protein